MNVSISELFATATSLHHLRHPNVENGIGQISLGERILGIALFALSGLVTMGVMYAFYLITAYKKVRHNPHSPTVQKTQKMALPVFNKKKAEMTAPLFDVVEKGDLIECKRLLFTKELNVNSFNSEGMPLLIHAVKHRQDAIIEYLLDQTDLNIDISRFNCGVYVGYTALHEATVLGDVKTIQLLLKKGIAPNTIDSDGRAPIHYAIHERNLEALKALITDPRVDIHVKDTQEGEYTPFLFAIERGCVDIVAELINTHKENLHFEDKDCYGNNIFHLLFNASHTVLTIKNGVDLFKLVFDACPQLSKKQLLNEKNQQHDKNPYELGVQALKDYLEERETLSAQQQKKYDDMSVLIEQLNPIKYS